MAEEIIGRVHPETETQAERIASDNDMKKIELLDILNSAISMCEPIKYSEFNKFIKAAHPEDLIELEQNEGRLGIKGDLNDSANPVGIATITHVLINKRLGVEVNDDDEIMQFIFV
jgi:hypothetical protein